ncbi:MAG TPA: hypothetical protein P5087_06115 [Eubacteriales bacterium]|nr:hypothetical protein [Eubacteriales bacterium]
MENEKSKSVVNFSAKFFVGALITVFALMIVSYILTFILPGGEFDRITTTSGAQEIVAGSYHAVDGGLPFWKWILSPILVLFGKDGLKIIILCTLMLILGGVFSAMDKGGVLVYLLTKVAAKFKTKKYLLLFSVSMIFALLGSFLGIFEEIIPLVPLMVALAYAMGWDAFVGLGMSLLATGCGFAAGVANIYTAGTALGLADLSLFSGIGYRFVSFAVIFAVLFAFLFIYAKKIEKNPEKSRLFNSAMEQQWQESEMEFTPNENKDKALVWFVSILGVGVVAMIMSAFVEFLQDILMPLMALDFLAAGTAACFAAGMPAKEYFKAFGKGALGIIAAVGLILMASSIGYILSEGKVLDTILNGLFSFASGRNPLVILFIIYGVVLIMNFFISSGSAKAFLLMPLILPLVDITGGALSREIAILAFLYGDGFSNMFYPTNAVLLIGLSLTNVPYGKWARWTALFQVIILVVTSLLLILAYSFGYGG